MPQGDSIRERWDGSLSPAELSALPQHIRRAIVAQREATENAELELSRAIGYNHNVFDDEDWLDKNDNDEE